MKRVELLSACALGALLAPAAAFAQNTADASPPAATAQAPDNGGIAEIIVTAQRREESVQRSSLAIDVLTSAELRKAGVSQTADLTRLVPGLQLAQVGTTAQPFIRGVGNASNTGTNDSGVAFSVDGIYIGQPISYGLDFYDLQRVEVLKGPQGTLYGRNATGGAINLITNQPTDKLEGNVTLEAGNYKNLRATGAINVPLASDLSARLAYNFVNRDGYFKDGTGDDVQQAARLRLKYDPGGVKLLVNLEYGHVGGFGGGSAIDDGDLNRDGIQNKFTLVNTWQGTTSPANLAQYNISRDKTQRPFNNINAYMASVQGDVDLGSDITLTVLPSYRRVTQKSATYVADFLYKPLRLAFDQATAEARLARNTANWKWVLGAYYYYQKIESLFQVDQQILPMIPPFAGLGTGLQIIGGSPNHKTRSYSFFGETTYGLTDRLRVIGGIRYTHERTTESGSINFAEIPLVPLVACTGFACTQLYSSEVSANNVSWKAGVEYDVAPRSLLFATVSTGFKAGGVFPAQAPRNTFKPEKLRAYELGLRNRFLDNRLQINLEGFYWDYKDKQETTSGFDSCGGPVCPAPLPPGNVTNLTINANKAEVYGGSADLVFRLTENDTFHSGVEYAHSKYKDFAYNVPSPPNTGCVQTPPSATNPFFGVNCSGLPLTRAPRWTVNADYQHIFPLANGGDITAGGSMSYTSSRYLDAHFLSSSLAPGYELFNADLTYNSAGHGYSVTAYIRNIGDKAAAITGYSLADSAIRPFVTTAVLQAPRTYGVSASFKF